MGGNLNVICRINMSERVRRNLPTLRSVHRMNEPARKQFIKTCHPDFLECLCECSKNLLKGNIPLNSSQFNKLRRYKKVLRTLATKKASNKTRRKLLQKGGFLPLLIGPALGLVSSLIGGAINRALQPKNK